MGNLHTLKDLIFESDNKACFIERERILSRIEKEMSGYSNPDKYAVVLAKLLSEVSTPILDCDYFAGRVLEALPDENMSAPNSLLCSTGHMSFDYEKMLAVGLKGILEEITASAAAIGTTDAAAFARNAEIIISAIRDFAHRYAEAAEEKGFDGKISVCVKREYFPARLYGNTILKEGVYPSVCVEIGDAEGKNWWCVIYPEYCVFEETDESTEIRFYSGIRSFFRKLFG